MVGCLLLYSNENTNNRLESGCFGTMPWLQTNFDSICDSFDSYLDLHFRKPF